jgi:hypothetical protein
MGFPETASNMHSMAMITNSTRICAAIAQEQPHVRAGEKQF